MESFSDAFQVIQQSNIRRYSNLASSPNSIFRTLSTTPIIGERALGYHNYRALYSEIQNNLMESSSPGSVTYDSCDLRKVSKLLACFVICQQCYMRSLLHRTIDGSKAHNPSINWKSLYECCKTTFK